MRASVTAFLGILAAIPALAGEAPRPAEGKGDRQAGETGARQDAATGGAADRVARASWILGFDARDRQGQILGKVTDLAVDLVDGRILFAVVEAPAARGEKKSIAVPWKTVGTPDKEARTVALDVSREEFQAGPTVAPSGKAVVPDDRWLARLQDHYKSAGAAPGATASAGGEAGESAKLPLQLEQGKDYDFVVALPGAEKDLEKHRPGQVQPGILEYRLTVKEVGANRRTLTVSFDRRSLESVAAGGTDQGKAPAARAGQAQPVSLTLTMDPSGKVENVQGLQPLGAANGQAVASHLRFILGSGLHDETLSRGRLYHLEPLLGAGGLSGADGKKGQGQPKKATDTGETGGSGEANFSTLDTVHFQGPSNEGGVRIAHFTVYSTSWDSLPAGAEGERERERAGKAVGKLTYDQKDGLLEKLEPYAGTEEMTAFAIRRVRGE